MSIGRNVAKLISSKAAAQVAVIVAAPTITRLFLPEHFGVNQLFISIATVIAVIACLRYEFSIPLGKDEKEASASLVLSLFFALIFMLVVSATVPSLKGKIARWYKVPELEIFLWLLPIAVFIGACRNSLRFWAAREERFGAMAWSDFSAAVVGILITVTWALAISASVNGLLAGYLANGAVGVLILFAFLSRKLVSDIKNSHLSFGMVWAVAKQHRKFPIFSTWSGLLNTVSFQLPPIILGLYFSTTVVGYYSLGQRVVGLPMGLLGNSIAKVFYPAAAKEYNKTGTLSEIVSKVFRRLVQIGVFPMVALGFFGASVFGVVFGENWIEAGVYAQIMSGYLVCHFVSSPLSTICSILQRQGTFLAWNAGFASCKLLGLLLGARTGKPWVALVLYSAANMVAYSLLMVWILRNSNIPLRREMKIFLKYIGLSCLLLLPAACFVYIWQNRFIALASLGLAIIIYVYGLYRQEPGLHKATVDIVAWRLPSSRRKRDKSLGIR
ncbi:oligosaccharide flippase family protein [Candidatus Poribacteria bacterium]